MPVYGPNLDIASNTLWDFPLIVELPSLKRQYTPKSDASLRINNFPHLLLEVISDQAQSDCNRMLLQAACLARLGGALRRDAANPFIVSAIYIDDELCAKWHFVYQPLTSDAAVRLILQEAVHYLRLGRLSTWWNPLILKMPRRRSTLCFGSTTSSHWPNAGNGSPKRPRNEDGDLESDTHSDVAISESLKRAGYTVPDEVEGFESFLPVRASFP